MSQIVITVYFDGPNDAAKKADREKIKSHVRKSGRKYASVSHFALLAMEEQIKRDNEK